MANSLLGLLGSYDIFGKSIPGAALVLGVWSLLPTSYFTVFQSTNQTDVVNLAVLLIILMVSGLMIGQWVHTIADNVEKVFRWLLNIIEDLRQVLVLNNIPVEFDSFLLELDEEEISETSEIGVDWYNGMVEWIRSRFWGFFDSFCGHRFLFAKWFQWNYVPENFWDSEETRFDSRWELHERDHLMDPFCDAYDQIFGEDIRRMEGIESIELCYPHVTARLDEQGASTYRQFQAIYSFCRGMWVVLFILSIAYALAIYQPFGNLTIIGTAPRIELLPSSLVSIIPVACFLASLVFLDASGTYKRHYIEYLIATFAALEGRDDTEPQTTFSQYD